MNRGPQDSTGVSVLEHEELEPLPRIRHPQLGEPATVYRYVDLVGDLVHVVCRFEPKTFRQARLEKGRWVWDLNGVERVLYRLPRVLEALAVGERIYIAEGEKDVDAIEASGAVATCNPMGAGPGKFTQAMAEQLRGIRYVTIVIDKDDESKRDTPQSRIAKDQSPKGADNLTPGERHALAIRDLLLAETGISSADIELVQAATGKDPYDHLAAGHSLDELVAWQPPAPPVPPAAAAATPGQPRAYPRTDLGNAERLVDQHGGDLRYVPALGWHAWDGARWTLDLDGEAQRRAKLTVRAIAVEAFEQFEGEERGKQIKHAIASEGRSRLESMVKLAETDRAVVARVDELDQDPYALNTRNGTVDLTTGAIRDHARTDHITKLCPIDYDPAASAPVWDGFLETIFAGDTDLIRFVQRAVGYSLTGSTDEQVLFILHGRGANGKSTFIETIAALLGDYAQAAPAEMLMQQTRPRGGATPDLARLPGARFVSAVETGEGRRIDEPLVKQLTGGDKMAARPLYKNVFEFTPTHKLWLATNHLPQIAGTDHAIWRRIRLIPFTVRIPDEQQDAQLKDKLRAELPGIVNWALAGCAAWLVEGLGVPASVTQATAAYRADMDELGAFIEEWCDLDDNGQVKASELLTLYGYWASANSGSPITANQLSKALLERGFQKHRVTDGIVYRGLKIVSRDQDSLN